MSKHRIMVEEETGEEMCYQTDLTMKECMEIMPKLSEDHVEWRRIWTEVIEDYTYIPDGVEYF